MELPQAKFFKEVLDSNGEVCRIEEHYSGRGAYGQTTVGFVMETTVENLLVMTLNYLQDFPHEVNELPYFDEFSTDNMGRYSIILY